MTKRHVQVSNEIIINASFYMRMKQQNETHKTATAKH